MQSANLLHASLPSDPIQAPHVSGGGAIVMTKFVLYVVVVLLMAGALAWHAWEVANSVSLQVWASKGYI